MSCYLELSAFDPAEKYIMVEVRQGMMRLAGSFAEVNG